MRTIFAALILLTGCFIQSCKEGCKDKTAINYNSGASVENGTCLYCKSSYTSDTATYFFTSVQAPNPNVNAVEFILVSTSSNISGNGCQSEGLTPTSSCHNYLRMINLTNRQINGSFLEVQYFQNASVAWSFVETQFISIQRAGTFGDTIDFGLIDSTGCSNLTSGTLSPDLNNLQFN